MSESSIELTLTRAFLSEMRAIHERNYEVAVKQELNITPPLILRGILLDLLRFPTQSLTGMLCQLHEQEAIINSELEEILRITQIIQAITMDLAGIILDLFHKVPSKFGAEDGPKLFKAYLKDFSEFQKRVLADAVRASLQNDSGKIVIPGKPN